MTAPALPGTSVPLPVPPDMTRAFGCPSDARYVVFWVEADTDDLMWTDGVRSGNAQPWVFKEYLRHRAVEPLLRGFDLTGPESELVLVIDQEGARASVATGEQAAEFLKQVMPPLPELSAEQIAAIEARVAEGWREEKVDQTEVMRQMQEQRARVGRMMSFLDMCPVPSSGRDTPP